MRGRGPRPLLSVLLAGGALLGHAAHAGAEPPPVPPPIAPVRYTENYAYLHGGDPDALEALSPWGFLKYIPLNGAGDIYLTLGAELRLRYERYRDNDWGQGPQDDDGYLWARALPLVDLHLGENVRFFGQPISAFAFGFDLPLSPVDENRLGVLQAFIDGRLKLRLGEEAALTLRLGRQLLTYGSGRLVDIRYGPNVLQTFDAAKAFIETDQWRVDALFARPVDSRPGVFDDRTDDSRSLWLLYGLLAPRETPVSLELYYIGYINEDAAFEQGTGHELRHTLGTRVFGAVGAWDWNFELFYQFGTFAAGGANGDISAWSVASDTGYTLRDLPLQPRLALKANVISGDRDLGDPALQTFNPLFPKGQYFGDLSPIGPANLIHVNPYVIVQLTDGLLFGGNLAFYWRESVADGIYALGSMDLLRAGAGSDARHIGTQAELSLDYQVDRHLSMRVSYSIFAAGDFIAETGADETIHFIGLEVMYRL